MSMKGCPFACSLFRSTRKTPTDSVASRSVQRAVRPGLHRVLNRSRSSARDTSDLTSTRDELADCGGLEPMLAVATDQVVHGVGNVRKGEGDCFHSTRACRSQESHGASSGALLNAPMLSSGEVAVTSAAFDCC